jgi:hypothetical protein
MTFESRALAVFVLLGCASTASVAQAPQGVSPDHPRAQKVRKPHPKRMKAVPASPPVAPPLQMSYENGLLSIAAQDASLHDILAQLHQRTGATIDAPPDVDERITVQLGPGPALKVIAALLKGTHLNYVIAGAPNDAGAVRTIDLTLQPTSVAPETPPPVAVVEKPPALSPAASKANLTGGDEGVWDDVEMGPPTAPPAVPAATPTPPAATPAPPH